MTVSAVNEPYKALQTKILAISGVTSLLATDADGNVLAGRDFAPTGPAWPLLTWKSLGDSPGSGLDVEAYDDHHDLLQFSFEGPDRDTLRTLGQALDEGLTDACFSAALDSAHYAVKILRRTSPWREIPRTAREDADQGEMIFRYTSDWTFRYLRKQNVA